MKRFICFLIILVCLLFAFDAVAAEPVSYGPNCHFEITQTFENGVKISETKVRKCTETIEENKQRFDPQNRFGDYVKAKVVEVGLLGILIAISK
jgi:exosome complex RNA-binding protein Csl4